MSRSPQIGNRRATATGQGGARRRQWGSDIVSGQITAAGAGYTCYDSNICRQGTFTNTGIQQQVSFCIIIAYTTIN